MKSVVLSLLLFLLILGAIVANSFYVSHFCDDILEIAQKLEYSEQKETLISEMKVVWNKNRDWLDFSIKLNEIERMNDLIESLESAYKANNQAEFSKYCALITELAQEFAEHEKLSLRSIC